MSSKVIRFGTKSGNFKKYSYDIEQLRYKQTDIYIRSYQKAYIGVLDRDKIVACLWLEKDKDECDFSIITHPQHRNKGHASNLVKELIHDRFSGKIKGELICEPVNPIMKKIIKRFKFSPDFRDSEFWTFDI